MKNLNKLVMLVAMTLSSVSLANAEAWRIQADNCWNKIPSDYTDSRIWDNADGSLFLQLTKMSFGRKNQEKCYVSITVPVRSENESCEGVNTMGFATGGRKSFATGEVHSRSSATLAQVFSHYSGSALGLAALGGVGHWDTKTKKGLHISDRIVAVPLPMAGGNLAVGYTSCRINFDIVPAATEALIEVDVQGVRHRQSIPLEQILNLAI